MRAMNCRMKKWARYRKKIVHTPEREFSKRKPLAVNTSPEDDYAINQTAVSRGAISLEGIGGKSYHSTLYHEYQIKQLVYLVLKIVLLVLVVALLIILYFQWVKR